MRSLPHLTRRVAVLVALGGLVASVVSVGTSIPAVAAPSWTIVSSPNSGPGDNVLDAVSCVSPGFCMAVGTGHSYGGGGSTLIESWDGASWSILPSAPDSPSVLDGVSCVSPSFCMAVGSGPDETIIESWDGTSWAVVPSPLAGYDPGLTSVSCVSPSSCQAVGDKVGSGPNILTLIESWDGTAWSVVPSPNQGTGVKSVNLLNGVSCVSPSSCEAVGSWGLYNIERTLIESWNGSTWSIVPKPNKRLRANQLNAVACISPSSCTAVGYHAYVGSGRERTFVESWDGAKWSVVRSPNKGLKGNTLNGVTCVSATSCEAVGQYSTRTATLTLIESWNGATWTITPSPNTLSGNDLDGVACTSAVSCQAVGGYGPSTGLFQTLVESYG